MMKTLIRMACLTAILGFGMPSMAQVTDMAKHVGHATKEAVEKVGETGKKVGTSATEGAKKVGTETEKAVTGAPRGSTGRCTDGTYTTSKTRSGACLKHGGVEKWF